MYAVLLMTVFWDLIWGVLVGMFVANLLTVDAITRSQLEGMEEDNPSNATDALHANLSPEEEALILMEGSRAEAYKEYVKRCMNAKITIRGLSKGALATRQSS